MNHNTATDRTLETSMRVLTIPQACLVKMYLGYLPMPKERKISRG